MDTKPTDDRDSLDSISADEHIGAVEGDRVTDQPQQGNPNAPALDEQGLPNDTVAICEDVIGAHVDESQG
jgi:hypothetical protein